MRYSVVRGKTSFVVGTTENESRVVIDFKSIESNPNMQNPESIRNYIRKRAIKELEINEKHPFFKFSEDAEKAIAELSAYNFREFN